MDNKDLYFKGNDQFIFPFQLKEYRKRLYAVRWKILNLNSRKAEFKDALKRWGEDLVQQGYLESGSGQYIAFYDRKFKKYDDPRCYAELRDVLFEYNLKDIVKASRNRCQLEMRVDGDSFTLYCRFEVSDNVLLFHAPRIDHLPIVESQIWIQDESSGESGNEAIHK